MHCTRRSDRVKPGMALQRTVLVTRAAFVALAACGAPAVTTPATPTATTTTTAPPPRQPSGTRALLLPAELAPTPKCTAPAASTSTAYPTTYPLLSAPERAARTRALQQAGYWAYVELDDYGFVRIARSWRLADVADLSHLPRGSRVPPGPQLQADDAAAWAGALACQPAAFGLDATTALAFGKDFVAQQKSWFDTAGRITLGMDSRGDAFDPQMPIKGKPVWIVAAQGHFWPNAVLPAAKLTTADAAARVVGETYDVTWTPGPPPCVSGSRCQPAAPFQEVLTVTATQVRTHQAIAAVRRAADGPIELRRVLRVDVQGSNGQVGANAKPRAGAPQLPYFVDAVTGEDLSGWPCGFADDLCRFYFGT